MSSVTPRSTLGRRRTRLGVTLAVLLAAAPLTARPASAAPVQLVGNPSVETVSPTSSSLPQSWTQVKSGKHRTTFSYPTSGAHTGSRYVKVAMSSFSSGWATWRFAPVAVVAGTSYSASIWYRASVATTLVAELRSSSGSITYQTLATVPAASVWTETTATLTPPAGTSTIGVALRLAAVGSLDVDDATVVGEPVSTALQAPSTPTVCATAIGQLAASWSAVTGAASYDVSYTPRGGSATVLTGITSTTRTITGLTAATYDVAVRAVPSAGSGASTSAWSNLATSTVVSSTATSLVLNGSLELTDSTCAAPQQWTKGGWGTNSRVLSIPSTGGYTGSRVARVDVTGYTSGDAKWVFDHVAVTPGATYVFSDWYRSNVASQLTIEYRSSSGVLSYVWLKDLAAASSWTSTSSTFTVPAGMASLTVFHLIARAGWLETDDVALASNGVALAPPTGLAATSSASDRFVANWNSAAGAVTYDLRYSGTSATGASIAAQTVTGLATTSATVTGLVSGWYSLQVRSVSATATSAWSTNATVAVGVTGTPPIPGLPSTFLAGYLEGWNLALPSTLPSQYELLYHAFAPVGSDGSVTIYLSGVSRTSLATEYKARRAAGLPTLLSIGGGGGAQVGLGTAAQQQAFLASVTPLIDEFGFSGIDWDLEAGIPGGISVSGLVAISRSLRATYGPSFLITMAPYGDPTVETPMRSVARELVATGDLAYVGFQFYNDNAPTTSSVLAKMNSWITDTGIRADQFVLGFWAGPWDWPAGYVMSESTMASIYQGVRAAHPTLRGSYTWGIRGTDQVRNWAYATTMWPVIHAS